jgi:PleD family two-component response regulator
MELGIMERADFAALRILLVSEKNHAAQTLRAVLTLAGITRITGVEDPLRAAELLTMDPYEAVFCAENCAPVKGLSFPMAVRRLPHILDPLMPVFVFQERARRRAVEAARDTGATGFLTCPVSPRTVMTKLRTALTAPRPFIKAPDYFGPDRRARQRPAWSGEERRVRLPRKIKVRKPAPDDTVLL